MRLLPYTRVIFKTKLTANEVKEQLLELWKEEEIFRNDEMGGGYGINQYEHILKGNRFEFRQKTISVNPYGSEAGQEGLIINGIIEESPNGTIIKVNIEPLYSYILGTALICLTILGLLLAITINTKDRTFADYLWFIMPTAIITLVTVYFIRRRNKYIRIFSAIFQAIDYQVLSK